ncbi:MAG: flagellar hook protein FlgE [Euryarchaeota archaeon]|nr:flagellar hook protein FlgE [Euryarchaeota archaeon]
MIRSLFTGISGIKSNQMAIEVVGNNIANINTPAYKANQASFADSLSLYLRAGTSPTSSKGGINPMQIGNGSSIGSISSPFTQGSIEITSNPNDLAIAGNGFFILKNWDRQYYTRDGSFGIDAAGNLVDPATGFVVQGRMADNSGKITSSARVDNITVDPNTLAPAKATSKISLTGNLNSEAKANDSYQMSVMAYDSLGNTHNILVTFEKATDNEWSWRAELSPGNGNTLEPAEKNKLKFESNGKIDNNAPDAPTNASLKISFKNGATTPQTISLDFSKLVQFSDNFSPIASERDGYGAGLLESMRFDESGTLVGTFSNGITQKLAQLVLADFSNPEGLTKIGSNLYDISANSGMPKMGYAGEEIRASIVPGALESSNVDLANEFVRMMIAQRGFEANSRVITTSDSILGELVNLKR